MRRPVGVILAGIILTVLALLGAFMGIFALAAPVLVHRHLVPRIPGVTPGLWLMVAFQLFCLWTAVSLIRMRPWTRPAMVVVGSVVFLVSGFLGAGLLWARPYAAMLPVGPYAGAVQTGIVVAASLFFLVALVGIWWIAYFSRTRAFQAEI